MTVHNKEVFIKPNEFVAVIKDKIFHSHSVLDMIDFFENNTEYDNSLAEMVFDGVDVVKLLTCSDTEQIIKMWREAQKENMPFLMEMYRNNLIKKADFIIMQDVSTDDNCGGYYDDVEGLE